MMYLLLLCFYVARTDSVKNLKDVYARNPTGIRIFHPAFPVELLNPLTDVELQKVIRVKELTGSLERLDISNIPKLPWKVMPETGISESSTFLSKTELKNLFEMNRHNGVFVWYIYHQSYF